MNETEDAGERKGEPGQAGHLLRDAIEQAAPVDGDQDCGAGKEGRAALQGSRGLPRGSGRRAPGRVSDTVLSTS